MALENLSLWVVDLRIPPCLFLLQQNVFPDRGTVYDFFFVKQTNGSWNNWIDMVDKVKNAIPKDAKVIDEMKHKSDKVALLVVRICSLLDC